MILLRGVLLQQTAKFPFVHGRARSTVEDWMSGGGDKDEEASRLMWSCYSFCHVGCTADTAKHLRPKRGLLKQW